MKKVFLSLFLASSLFACTQTKNEPAKEIGFGKTEVVAKKQTDANIHDFAKRNGWDMLDLTKKDWQSMDTKYKKIVGNVENQSSEYFDKFCQVAIQEIVLECGLAQSTNKEALEFYYNELLKCKGQNPEVVYNLLIALKPSIGAQKVHEYAQIVLEKRKNYSEAMQKQANANLEKTYQKVRDFAEKLKSL